MRRIHTHEDGQGLTELCAVYAADEAHPVNGAHHKYEFIRGLTPTDVGNPPWPADYLDSGQITFQRGPRNVPGSTPGILDGCLLAVLIDRLECFQAGPFECDENAVVLGHLNAALDAMKARARERAARGVLGKNEK